MPKISVIIPIYNAEKYLNECLNSVVNQTYTNIEIICINDGSTDNSLKTLEEYAQKDNRIKIINQENQGVSVTRNTGIKLATGEYILFIDADDYIDTSACEYMVKQINNGSFDVLCFNYIGFNNNIYRKFNVIGKLDQLDKLTLLHNGSSASWNKLYRTAFIKKHNINFMPDLPIAEDTLFWFSLVFYDCKIRTLSNYLYYYRENNYSSATKKWSQFFALNIYAYKKMKETEIYKQMTPKEQLMVTDFFGKSCFSIWSGLPQKEYQKEYNKLIKQFLENYSSFNYKDYKNLVGYKRIKYRYWTRILKQVRNFYFSIRYRIYK